MTFSDYPDFMPADLRVGRPFVSGTVAAVPNGFSWGPFFVGAFEAIALEMWQPALADNMTVTVTFIDGIGGSYMGGVVYYVATNRLLEDVIAVKGMYMSISISDMSAPRDIHILTYPANRAIGGLAPTPGFGSLTNYNLFVVAANSATVGATIVSSLKGTLTVTTTAASWKAELRQIAIGYAGYDSVVAGLSSVTHGPGGSVPVVLGPRSYDLVFTNNDAAGRNFSTGLVFDRFD